MIHCSKWKGHHSLFIPIRFYCFPALLNIALFFESYKRMFSQRNSGMFRETAIFVSSTQYKSLRTGVVEFRNWRPKPGLESGQSLYNITNYVFNGASFSYIRRKFAIRNWPLCVVFLFAFQNFFFSQHLQPFELSREKFEFATIVRIICKFTFTCFDKRRRFEH